MSDQRASAAPPFVLRLAVALASAFLLSTLVGALIGIVMVLAGQRSRQTPIPFGPYLAAAGWIALLWGERIVQTYLELSGLS